ncbi:MAG: flagellar type III secretion system pore protein FliP [Alphaproteobacteria bacterium]|nr:flagellar type III secretion system pore protein FliP [Alphaproteobacteria bacterium]
MKRFSPKLPFLLAGLVALAVVLVPGQVFAQSITFNAGHGPSMTARIIQMILLITVLSLAPSILVMVTSFTRIIVVLSFLRTALGTQTTPPNVVLISLALFLTMFIMQPTFDVAWTNGIQPLMNNQIDEQAAFTRTVDPFRDFMLKHTRPKDLDLFAEISKENAQAAAAPKASDQPAMPTLAQQQAAANAAAGTAANKGAPKQEVSLRALIPAFMISELRRAFEIGFLLFLPFLIIDMVVASLLMSMGMMMLPPSLISLPFKIIFFVLVDGWYLICGSLIQSYGR